VETTKCSDTNLFHCHFVHHKFHMTPPRSNRDPRGNSSATKGSNCSTAHRTLQNFIVGEGRERERESPQLDVVRA